MVDNELNKLIELNENIVSQNKRLIVQNEKIIRLLSKIAGEDEKLGTADIGIVVGEDGEVVIGENLMLSDIDSSVEIEDDIPDNEEEMGADESASVLGLELDVGEVLFVSNSSDDKVDIYKLTVRDCDEFTVVPAEFASEIEDEIGCVNNEIIIENLTGEGITSQFKVPLLVAFESYNQDVAISSSRVILDDELFDNLPDILRIAIENGAKKVHLSLKNAMATLSAPPVIANYLEFYKTREQILEKLF